MLATSGSDSVINLYDIVNAWLEDDEEVFQVSKTIVSWLCNL